MVYFSGLRERLSLSSGLDCLIGEREIGVEVDGRLILGLEEWWRGLLLLASAEARVGSDGRWGSDGRDNSEYVTAGIVPEPIDPFDRLLGSRQSAVLESLLLAVGV